MEAVVHVRFVPTACHRSDRIEMLFAAVHESGCGTKRTSDRAVTMSALELKADIERWPYPRPLRSHRRAAAFVTSSLQQL